MRFHFVAEPTGWPPHCPLTLVFGFILEGQSHFAKLHVTTSCFSPLLFCGPQRNRAACADGVHISNTVSILASRCVCFTSSRQRWRRNGYYSITSELFVFAACSRPTTAVSQGRAAESQQQQQQLQSSAGRHGVIAARAQRIASAKQNTKQPRQPSLTSGNAPLAAAGLEAAGLTPRPQTGRARPMTAASSPQPTLNGNRPSTSSSSRRSTPGSSMDSVTFESELARTAERRASPRTPSTPPTAGVRLMPSVQLPPAEKPAPNATTTVVVVASAEVHNNDTDEEYQEVRDEFRSPRFRIAKRQDGVGSDPEKRFPHSEASSAKHIGF